MLIPEPIEKTLNFPWHLTKGIAHVVAFPIRAILQTDYLPKQREPENGEATLFDVTKPMLDIASIIYYYTELRSETNKRLDEYRKKINLSKLELEFIRNGIQTAKEIRNAIQLNISLQDEIEGLKKAHDEIEGLKSKFPDITDGDIEVLATYFDILGKRKRSAHIKRDIELYNNYISAAFSLGFGGKDFNLHVIDMVDRCQDMYIHTIDDDFTKTSMNLEGFSSSRELVYAIVVSEKSKRLTVVFRGSVNGNDWVTNLSGTMTNFGLPGFTSESTSDLKENYGRVHMGFYRYLFGKTKVGNNGSNKSKGEEIMGILCSLLENECKGFSVFVTGHSIGGALSTMFAFRAALNGDLPIVTNVSFASPYVGDQGFRDHFYKLEKENKIRHLRIANDEDAVPLILPAFPAVKDLLPELEMYKHTGMNIRLYNHDQVLMPKCRLFYPKEGSWPNEVRNAVLNSIPSGLSVGVIGKHLCPEYFSRLASAEKELKRITVEGLYQDVHITGWEVGTYKAFK